MGRDSGRWALSTEQPQGKTSFVLRLFVILVKQVSRLAVHFNSKVLVDQGLESQVSCPSTILLLWPHVFLLGNQPTLPLGLKCPR